MLRLGVGLELGVEHCDGLRGNQLAVNRYVADLDNGGVWAARKVDANCLDLRERTRLAPPCVVVLLPLLP